MKTPSVMRPTFPQGYVEHPTGILTWGEVLPRLVDAKNYWLCTVRPDGRPHTIPKWGVWVGGGLYFDGSLETRHARNIAVNPEVGVHLESGDEAVILEGRCVVLPRPGMDLAEDLAQEYARKYAAHGYAPEPTELNEGWVFAVTPRVVLAWTSFTEDPTKFVFEQG